MAQSPERTLILLDALREVAVARPVRVQVSGHCMAPLVRDGARVEVSAPSRFYWPGDVVVALTQGRGFALHRVIGCYRRGGQWKFITRGDAAARPDTAVVASAILGRVYGGECSARLVNIPLWHRVRAFGGFLRFAATLLAGRWGHSA